MARALKIIVWSTDDTDIDWLQSRCVAAVEEEVEEQEGHLDGDVTVDWEYIDIE